MLRINMLFNGDTKQLKPASARRRSHTQDGSYYDVPSEPVMRRSGSQVRPHSHSHKASPVITEGNRVHPYGSGSDGNLSCGVIPQELQSRLLDLKDYKSRTYAIEELKYLIQDWDFSSVSHSHMVGFISFLCTLLDDSNFTVVLVTLDVLNCFVINLGENVKEFLKPIIAATVKLLGDGKITVKQEYMKIYMRLMKVAGPCKVLTVLLENLKHKNSRVREEVVNICIVSLLTYPSEDFNLPYLACEIAPCLIDSKWRVRHAALEAFAVLAVSMGPGKSSLLKAVDEVELQEDGDGLMMAVQARLARKTLPRISPQGLVEYALPFPSSAQMRGTYHVPGADTDWLLSGNRALSRQSMASDHSGRSMVPHIDPVARRMLSAGKGKNKFPWESQDPGVVDVFPGTPTSDQLPATVDVPHKRYVKTPEVKTRNSSMNQASANISLHSEPLPALSGKDEAPVPLKASITRLPSGRKDLNRSKPVPPITKGTKFPEINSVRDRSVWSDSSPVEKTSDEENIAIDFLELSLRDEDDHEEMISSLRHLRNSAAKKRAKISGSLSDLDSPDSMKIDLNMDSPLSAPSPIDDGYSESGVYSRESLTSPLSPTPQLKRVPEVTSVPKPKLRPSRVLSARNRDGVKKPDSLPQGSPAREKPVTVIGQRMNYRNGTADAEEDSPKEITPTVTRRPSKDLQKPSRPMKGITGSATNFQQIYNHDFDVTNPLSEDSVAVIGKGVFETSPSAFQSHSQSSFSMPEDSSPVKQNIQPPTGVYGRAVQQSSPAVESDVSVMMCTSAREKMRQKREHSLKELTECRDPERKERLSQTDPSPVCRESRRPRSDCVEIADIKPPTLKRASSIKRSSAPRSSFKDRSSASRSSEVTDPSVPRELPRPDLSLAEAFKLLCNDDWEKKIEGLALVRSLAMFHSDVLLERLHDLSVALIQEVKNLRSSVSRAAIGCLGDMFVHLKKNMDNELDNCARVLLSKAAESNLFMREDVDKALDAMVQNVTPVRALTSLINGGLSHLNTAVKRCTAQHMCDLVERMGPGRILSGIKDITDKTLPAITKCAQDSSQETRFYGRKMLHYLMSHPDFDKMLEKYVPSKDLPYIKEIIRHIQVKGVGEIQDAPSARGRRSYHGSVGSLRASSVSQNAHVTLESASHRDDITVNS
ncbi:TOG array regulator of axonemal microtubules protein 1-like [Pseudophryne corroboree]|uniref:TOG array regulator of axonemal microtubules protein 1-like n=1 Tax=Pseudophryne corroboree TaxID=495146 RepID=UPI0030816713